MSGMDFEYAIKKDIRNNPIVREVDEARQRQLWRSMGIGLFLVVVLLFSAWQHFEMLRHGYQIERMQAERAAEEEDVDRHPSEVDRLLVGRHCLLGDNHHARWLAAPPG